MRKNLSLIMELSSQSLCDLRAALKQSYGENFDVELSDEDIQQIGELFLTGVVSYLKMRVSIPEVTATSL